VMKLQIGLTLARFEKTNRTNLAIRSLKKAKSSKKGLKVKLKSKNDQISFKFSSKFNFKLPKQTLNIQKG